MKAMLIASLMVFAFAGHAEDRENEAGSVDIDGCFECNKDRRRVGPEDPQVTAQNRTTDVFGKAAPSGESDSNATKEQGK